MSRTKTHNRQPIYFVVMGSVFHTDLEIHKIYDLKGSTHGRKATEKDKSQETPVLKDLDFLENKEVIQIGSQKSKLFVEQIRRDTELLRKLKIMDYSLLVGIHYSEKPEWNQPKSLKIQVSGSGHSDDSGSDFSEHEIEDFEHHHHHDHDHNHNQHGTQPPKHTETETQTPTPTQTKTETKSGDTELEKENTDTKNGMNTTNNSNDAKRKNSKQLEELGPKQSTTTPSNDPQIEMSEDGARKKEAEEKKDNLSPLQPASGPNKPGMAKKRLSYIGPGLMRLPSRRISQLPGHDRYTIKTPLEKHFDMPELVEYGKMDREEKADVDEEHINIFATEHGGMQQILEDGSEGDAIYFCGIIDILQKYNKRKKVENFFRGLNTDTATISAVPPEQYASRMYEFLKDKIL